MADWQTHTYADTLPSLDGSIIVGTSCLQPLPTLVLIDSWTAENDQATHAFMSTGTYIEMYDGSPCTDGGMTTGPKMTPLFQDEARPQLIVDLMATGFPSDMVYKVDLDQYEELIKIGMDEMEQYVQPQPSSLARPLLSLALSFRSPSPFLRARSPRSQVP
jgi:hypothetical protein